MQKILADLEKLGVPPMVTIAVFVILVLFVLFAVRSGRKADTSLAQSVVKKDSYDGEVDSAILILGETKEKFEYKSLTDVNWGWEHAEVRLQKEDGTEIFIRLGDYDLLICHGPKYPADFTNLKSIRVWAKGADHFGASLAEVDYDRDYGIITGYNQMGADVQIMFGRALTVAVE